MDPNSHAGSKLLLVFTWQDWFCHFTLAPSSRFSFLVPVSTMVWPITTSLEDFLQPWGVSGTSDWHRSEGQCIKWRFERKEMIEKARMWRKNTRWACFDCQSPFMTHCLQPSQHVLPSSFLLFLKYFSLTIPFTAIKNRAKQFVVLFTRHI